MERGDEDLQVIRGQILQLSGYPAKDFKPYPAVNSMWLKEFKFASSPSTFRKNHYSISKEH